MNINDREVLINFKSALTRSLQQSSFQSPINSNKICQIMYTEYIVLGTAEQKYSKSFGNDLKKKKKKK